MEIRLKSSEWLASETYWDQVGPFYEDDPVVERGATHRHAWGAQVGCFAYEFHIPVQARRGVMLRARLSSEHSWYSSPPNHFTDLTLSVNTSEYPSRRIIPDNGTGRNYEWRIDAADLFPGRNVIKFVVPRNAAYHNGLCIYDDALVPGAVSAHIVLEVEEDHHQGFLP